MTFVNQNTFSGAAVGGGFLDTVVGFGNRRGVFSNEAVLGSAPIAHAAQKIKDPVAQFVITICH